MRPHKRRKWNDPEELAHRAGLRLVGREGGQLLFAVEQPQRDRARVPADGAVE
jgi:hypothetical protein